MVLFTACSSSPESSADNSRTSTASSVIVVDQAGRTVGISYPVDKIVSGYYISSSACIALGLADKLVGVEAKADTRPIYGLAAPELLKLPNVGTAKDFNLEACAALKPDLVILPISLQEQADTLTGMGIPTILVNPENYSELRDMISLIGFTVDDADTADQVNKLLNYYDDTLAAINNLTADITDKPSVFMCGVSSYLSTSPKDMYQSTLIDLAGGVNAAADIDGSSWTAVSYEQLLAMNPDVIIIPSEAGYAVTDILNDPQLAQLTAVKDSAVYKMPSDFEAWDSPVPSCMLGTQWLLSILHGDVYSMDAFKKDASAFYSDFYGITINTALIG